MTLAEMREKCKSLTAKVPRDVLVIAVMVLASLASFGLGYLAGRDTGQGSVLRLEESPVAATSEVPGTSEVSGGVVASKNGTKYYFPSCAGVARIAPENKVWFASVSAAVTAGYALAANCTGP